MIFMRGGGNPKPEDVFAVVEVVDMVQARVCKTRLLLYARAGISEVWVVDLKAQVIEVYREPSMEGYLWMRVCDWGQGLSFRAFSQVMFNSDELLG